VGSPPLTISFSTLIDIFVISDSCSCTQEDKMSSKKSITKVATVITLAQRKSGVTLDQIAKQLKISSVAASSLIGDARRKGVKVGFSDGVYRA
jgi:DNA-binding transcriptional regulator LsrR (DeoR family)